MSRRPPLRVLVATLATLVMPLVVASAGCVKARADTVVHSSNGFPHARHVEYFASGRHRQEKIAMHVTLFGGGEAPEPITSGRCVECHDDLAAKPCGVCHVLFQNAGLRERTQVRPCVACHAATWSGRGSAAARPETCVACHVDGAQPGGPTLERVRFELPQAARSPRPTTLPPNVYFSHRAHVRFGNVACTTCHERGNAAAEPSPAVRFMPMTECLRCHRDNGASTDCLTCHR